MEILKDRYTITELSARLNVTDHALRYYEKEFNLQIPKDERGRRYYTTELANVMYQITTMRSEGLEIKAIRRILQSENIIPEPPPVVINENCMSLVNTNSTVHNNDIKTFFIEFKDQLSNCVSTEINSAKDHFSKELNRTKLELGACVENSMRKLETKMDKHFQEVDRSLGAWREKSKQGFIKRILSKSKKH